MAITTKTIITSMATNNQPVNQNMNTNDNDNDGRRKGRQQRSTILMTTTTTINRRILAKNRNGNNNKTTTMVMKGEKVDDKNERWKQRRWATPRIPATLTMNQRTATLMTTKI
jgi:hypothetical protein